MKQKHAYGLCAYPIHRGVIPGITPIALGHGLTPRLKAWGLPFCAVSCAGRARFYWCGFSSVVQLIGVEQWGGVRAAENWLIHNTVRPRYSMWIHSWIIRWMSVTSNVAALLKTIMDIYIYFFFFTCYRGRVITQYESGHSITKGTADERGNNNCRAEEESCWRWTNKGYR